MNDHAIIELFFRRDQGAILEAQEKYGAYCLSVAQNILENREDSQECLNDLWLKAWNAIPPERPKLLRAYFAKIIRNLAINRHQAQRAQKRAGERFTLSLEELAESIPAPNTPEEALWAGELSRSLNAFLETEKELDRVLFVRRYFSCQSCEEMARDLGLSPGQVRTRLSRIRDRLRKYLNAQDVFL